MEEIKITQEESDMLLHGQEYKPGEEGELTDTAAEHEAARAAENVSDSDTHGGDSPIQRRWREKAREELTPDEVTLAQERISITFYDLHCIARLLQSAMAKPSKGNPYQGCQHCRFCCFEEDETGRLVLAKNADFVMDRLYRMTGVGIGQFGNMLGQNMEKEKSPCLDNKDFSDNKLRKEFHDSYVS